MLLVIVTTQVVVVAVVSGTVGLHCATGGPRVSALDVAVDPAVAANASPTRIMTGKSTKKKFWSRWCARSVSMVTLFGVR
jgi:hypothetical protein